MLQFIYKNKIIKPTVNLEVFTKGYIMVADNFIRAEDKLIDEFGVKHSIVDYKEIKDEVIISNNPNISTGLDFYCFVPHTIVVVKRLALKLNIPIKKATILMVDISLSN